MNTKPWQLWSKDGKPTAEAALAKSLLEKQTEKPYHPQICHLYIHLLELSPYYKEAVRLSDRLFDNVKGVGHLLHMPSHIYVQVGMYEKSLESNVRAVAADSETKKIHPEDSFYEFYRAHNAHFAVWSAMFLADFDTAWKYSKIIQEHILPQTVIEKMPAVLEWFVSVDLHVLIRFGKWQQIIDMPMETRGEYTFYMTIQRYARAIANAATGKVDEAEH
jgi:hypothetical protein